MKNLKLDFNKGDGLIPAIVQDFKDGQILMLGYMNKESFKKTVQTKKAVFYSRSRNQLWLKGETSGNFLLVKEIFTDCDYDTILIKAEQVGDATCHTGRRSCFFYKLDSDNNWEIKD